MIDILPATNVELQALTGLKSHEVARHMAYLRKRGFVDRDAPGPRGKGAPTVYILAPAYQRD